MKFPIMCCKNCHWAVPNTDNIGKFECRINPPTPHLIPVNTGNGVQFIGNTTHPIVSGDNWCSLFEPKGEGIESVENPENSENLLNTD